MALAAIGSMVRLHGGIPGSKDVNLPVGRGPYAAFLGNGLTQTKGADGLPLFIISLAANS